MLGEIETDLVMFPNLPDTSKEQGQYKIELDSEKYLTALYRLPKIISGEEIETLYRSTQGYDKIDLLRDNFYYSLPLLSHEEEILYLRALRFFEFVVDPQKGLLVLEEDRRKRETLDYEDNDYPKIPFFEPLENQYFTRLLNKYAGQDVDHNLTKEDAITLFALTKSDKISEDFYKSTASEIIKNITTLLQFSNIKLARAIANGYAKRCSLLSYESDIFSYAFSSIIEKGIPKFDHTKGFHLSTYLTYWIKQYSKRFIENHTKSIRIPVHLQNKFSKMFKLVNKEEQVSETELTEQRISNLLLEQGYSEKDISLFFRYKINIHLSSLDDTQNNRDKEKIPYDYIPQKKKSPEKVLEEKESLQQAIKIALNSELTRREFTAIYLRLGFFGDEINSLEDIGIIMNLTKERIRQLLNLAHQKLNQSQSASPIKNNHRKYAGISTFKDENEAKEWIMLNYWVPSTIVESLSIPKGKDFINEETYKIIRLYYGLNEIKPTNTGDIAIKLGKDKKEIQYYIGSLKQKLKNIYIPVTIIPDSPSIYDYLEETRSNRIET